MKVALLLTGLARNVIDGYNQYWKHIINNYETDVYLYYWEDGEWESVLNVYSPKKYVCKKPFSFLKERENVISPNDALARPIFPYDVAGNFTSLPMIYSWQNGYNLLEGNYDCIIRSRFDVGGNSPIDLHKIDLKKINISNHHWPNSQILDDNILISNQFLASKLYTDIFDVFVENIKNEGVIYFAEKNFTNIVKQKKLYHFIKKSDEINFKLLRKFKVWY